MPDSSVSSRFLLALLAYRNTIAALVGATFVLTGLDAPWEVSVGVGLLIGWFVK